ncbi:MAG: AzlC family ABC transporter permease [Actinomycetia bacterium]|nr:AzlC family ABC transporter permease [Actinomycetes bacterium]MCP5030440.1 AzlC family ABC transporter permease [Actinomycetes bacterium]
MRQALSISFAVVPFGVAFGVAADQAGLRVIEAVGFSALVFTGSAQFAAVSVLADGGTVAAAIISGLLLNLRSLAFGIVMAPALRGPIWWRALASQLMIDESMAVASAQQERRWQRYGFLAGGLGVFVFWNTSTLLGASVLSSSDDLIERAGIDATIPAAFLALLWPRLVDRTQRLVALLGAGIALLTAPLLPPGLPIIAAAAAVLMVKPWKTNR